PNLASIVKWFGPFYDTCDNGPYAGAASSLQRSPDRPSTQTSPDGIGLRTSPGWQDYDLPVDQRCLSQLGQCRRSQAVAARSGRAGRSSPIRPPVEITSADWDALWEHGGFPEPFLRRDSRFTRRWHSLRQEQLSREDLREVAHVNDLGTMETLMQLLAERSAQQLIYSSLAR